MDYARSWYDSQDGPGMRERLTEYNAYLQVLDDLEANQFQIPGYSGPEIAKTIRVHVRDDFRRHTMRAVDSGNDYHKAFFAHCCRRWLQQLREGTFRDEETGKHRDGAALADAIEARVNEIYERELLQEQGQLSGVMK